MIICVIVQCIIVVCWVLVGGLCGQQDFGGQCDFVGVWCECVDDWVDLCGVDVLYLCECEFVVCVVCIVGYDVYVVYFGCYVV